MMEPCQGLQVEGMKELLGSYTLSLSLPIAAKMSVIHDVAEVRATVLNRNGNVVEQSQSKSHIG